MNYNRINTSLTCSLNEYEALRDALATRASDFSRQNEVDVSAGFRHHFPPSRLKEPLSGLWDYFDPQGVGYSALEWRDPSVTVSWAGDRAILAGSRISIERTIAIVRHVLRHRLPIVIEWLTTDHLQRVEFTQSRAALIGIDETIIESSASIAARWRAEHQSEPTPKAAVSCPPATTDDGEGSYFDIYLAEELTLENCTDRFAAPINAALRQAGVGHVEQPVDWGTDDYFDHAPDTCNEIALFADNLAQAVKIAREMLAQAGCRVGCQIQYEEGSDLLFVTRTAQGWSEPRTATVIDDGRAYEGEVWSGGVPC